MSEKELQSGGFLQSYWGQLCVVLGAIVAVLLVTSIGFYQSSRASADDATTLSHHSLDTGHGMVGNPAKGKEYFSMTCITCHGDHGQGIPPLGANLAQSKFVASHTDDELIAFVKKGRLPGEPNSVMNGTMPPNGANPTLDDRRLRDVIAYVRTFQPAIKPPVAPVVAAPTTAESSSGVH